MITMVIKKVSGIIGSHLSRFIEYKHKCEHKNYLLKCPLCESEDLIYFRSSTTKANLIKKLKLIFRHEYHCRACDSFISSKNLLRLELQKGDKGYVDEELLQKKQVQEKQQVEHEKTQKKGVEELFSYPKEECPTTPYV